MSSFEKTYVDAYTGDESVAMFITFAIEQYKNYKGISGEEAAATLAEAGVLEHLEEYYDVLHTQGAQWLMAEIDEMVGNHIIENPEIREPNRTLDFGKGFYVTSSQQQAERWVKGHLKGKYNVGYVNSYEFDMETLPIDLKVKIFPKADEEWIDFVLANRLTLGFNHDYDLVFGPVANDNVYAQITLFEGGIISKQSLIEELKAYKLVDQYLFHTERSLQFLHYISNYPVEI